MAQEGRLFSNRTYAAPFGRYEGGRPAEYPGNEVLVGRERERARMLNWLLSLGSRGAHLVTGYRGVGKTSFVNFCLRRYEEDVYGRYQQSRVGRALFWDRIIVVGLHIIALLLPLFASQLASIYFLSPSFRGDGLDGRPGMLLGWLVAGPLLLVALYPLAYAWSLFRVAARAGRDWIFMLCWIVVLSTASLLVGPFASPRVGSACFLALLAYAYCAVRACSISVDDRITEDPSSAGFTTSPASSRWVTQVLILFGSLALLLSAYFDSSEAELERNYLVAAAAFAVAGFAIRGFDAYKLYAYLVDTREDIQRLPRAQLRKIGANLGLAIALALLAWFYLGNPALLSWLVLIVVAIAGSWRWLNWRAALKTTEQDQHRDAEPSQPEKAKQGGARPRRYWFRFYPRPRLLLTLKGVFVLVFAVQLLAPIARVLLVDVAGALPLPRWSLVGHATRMCTKLDPWTAAACWIEHGVFGSLRDELGWLGLSVLFGLCLMYLEHDWIIRRHERARRDDPFDPAAADKLAGADSELELARPNLVRVPAAADKFAGADSRMELLRVNQELARATGFFWIFQTWLPVLTVRINLGFDNLSHTQVLTSMLVGLRDEYHRIFVSRRSRLGLISRLCVTAVTLLLALVIGGWTARELDKIPLPDWVPLARGLHIQDRRQSPTDHMLSYILPYEETLGPTLRPEIVVTGYQVAAFLVLLLLARWLGHRTGAFYHSEIHGRMSAILASLSSNVRVTRGLGSGLAIERLGFKFANNDSEQTETAPQDPRTIEQAFLGVLRDVLAPHLRLPVPDHLVSLPCPQVTFVFDELDKLGTRTPDLSDEGAAADGAKADASSLDRERSRKVHRLLADMKNLLSVAPVRFIFVGGRDLHDEWLADRTARQPLLSNIFDAEIYLPTLLVDPIGERRGVSDVNRSIHAYLNAQLARNFHLHHRWERRKRGFQWFSGGRYAPDQFFTQAPNLEGPLNAPVNPPTPTIRAIFLGQRMPVPTLANWQLYETVDQGGQGTDSTVPDNDGSFTGLPWGPDFLQKYSEYLTFRSRGNPKRLDALIESLVRPTGREVRNRELRWRRFDSQHVLRFGRAQRSSIQLVASIYRRLGPLVSGRATHGDDKNVRSTFYLADYLMKFHRRAFSWTNLGRIDEVLHAHRAPDLRRLLGDLVLDWSQCFLQPILNGMYTFRFRSELAAEIRCVSSSNESEMAAFNFTLDESHELKREYERRLERLSRGGESLVEVRAALGELCDFDEDYEEARRHYLGAITALDAQSARSEDGLLRITLDGQPGTPTTRIQLRQQVEWGVSRLRLMLQIGMTFERSRNYERALVEYRNARTLARALWFAMLDDYGRGPGRDGEQPLVLGSHRIDALKHLHILYQPLFATAWVSDKVSSGIDTSLTMVEDGLRELRQRLPFVRLPSPERAEGPARARHANFALAMADLHHNAGNLYFFKGRQTLNLNPACGYLDQAHYHYAVALHEVRRWHTYRYQSSSAKLNPLTASPATPAVPSLPDDVLPDFVLRRITSALFGLANSWLAQISLSALIGNGELNDPSGLRTPRGVPERPLTDIENVRLGFGEWLANGGDLSWEAWVGTWLRTNPGLSRGREDVGSEPPPLENGGRVIRLTSLTEAQRVLGYIWFSRLAARLLAEGGHYEEAAHEHLRIAATIEALVTSIEAYCAFDWRNPESKFPNSMCTTLLEHGCEVLHEADRLLRLRFGTSRLRTRTNSEAKTESDPGWLLGGWLFDSWTFDRVPAHAKRLVRSLGLAAERLEGRRGQRGGLWGRLAMLACRWPNYAAKDSPPVRAFKAELEESLESNAFPILNHLMTLRALIVHEVLLMKQRQTGQEQFEGPTPQGNLDDLIKELREVDKVYNSPMHFTPFYSGSALALYVLRDLEKERPGETDDTLEARRKLLRSQHTYCSRAAYYEAISNLYYLDDDFNDRCIQVRHAVQMMGRDLTALLLARLGRSDVPFTSDSPTAGSGPQPQTRYNEAEYRWVRSNLN